MNDKIKKPAAPAGEKPKNDKAKKTAVAPAGEKLQKVLARMAFGSRRDIEQWISDGRVLVNSRVAKLGARVDALDAITVDGRPLKKDAENYLQRRVLIYNKPEGEVCTRSDPEGRPTVFDRLPRPHTGRWINIGRLDINTTGLLMFTTDGELANRLMHREYAVRVRGEVTEEMIENLKRGVMLEDGPAKFTDVQAAPGGEGYNRWFHCVVMEGRNREVRRLWESQGVIVSRLKRVRFGPVFMTSELSMGRWREMGQAELDILSKEVGLEPIALPEMSEKAKDKLDRQQRKIAKPVAAARNVRRGADKTIYTTNKEQPAEFAKDSRKPRASAPAGGKKGPSSTRNAPVRRLRPE